MKPKCVLMGIYNGFLDSNWSDNISHLVVSCCEGALYLLSVISHGTTMTPHA